MQDLHGANPAPLDVVGANLTPLDIDFRGGAEFAPYGGGAEFAGGF